MPRNIIVVMLMIFNLVFGTDRNLYILHTNNTNGTLENCYCADHPYGAIEKRAAFIKTWLEDHPNTIIVDSGDIISLTGKTVKDSLASVAYSHIPYDAILLGDQELIHGADYIADMIKRIDAPIVNTNISRPRIKKSRPHLIVERDGIKIAILGVVGPVAIKYYPESVKSAIDLQDLNEVVTQQIKDLEQKADIILLLTHQGYDRDLKLAANLPGIDIIIGAHSQTSLRSAQEINNVLIAQAGKEGYYVGIIKIQVDANNQIVKKSGYLEAMTLEMPDHPLVMELIEEYEQKTGIINRRKSK